MLRPSRRKVDDMMDEHIRRMGEPEPYRSLRLQKERIDHERQQRAEKAFYDAQVAQLRKEIRELGEKPCA